MPHASPIFSGRAGLRLKWASNSTRRSMAAFNGMFGYAGLRSRWLDGGGAASVIALPSFGKAYMKHASINVNRANSFYQFFIADSVDNKMYRAHRGCTVE